MEDDMSDSKAMDVARRFLDIASRNEPSHASSNSERIAELEHKRGLQLKVAAPHGANNCLIDAIALGLMDHGVLPQGQTKADRKRLCEACRTWLQRVKQIPYGTYLDGQRDAPSIVQFLVQQSPTRVGRVDICYYNRFQELSDDAAMPALDSVQVNLGDGAGEVSVTIHVFNHTLASGHGYHFDALIPARERRRGREASRNGAGNNGCETEDGKAAGKPPAMPGLDPEKIQRVLQSFLNSRRVNITVTVQDSLEVIAQWGNREGLGAKLHTLQQSGLAFADSGWHASNRLVEQWFGFYNSCAQGPGQRLGARPEAREENESFDASSNPDPCNHQTAERKRVPQGSEGAPENQTSRPQKRLRRKTPAGSTSYGFGPEAPAHARASVEEETDMFILRCQPANTSCDPRAKEEWRARAVSEMLSAKPTLPWCHQSLQAERHAFDLPMFHCSFRGCDYACDVEEELLGHVQHCHADMFKQAAGQSIGEKERAKVYCMAMTMRCQDTAPVANSSLDRKALRNYRKSLEGDRISCLLCFVCARKFPHVETRRNQDIEWFQPVNEKNKLFLGSPWTWQKSFWE